MNDRESFRRILELATACESVYELSGRIAAGRLARSGADLETLRCALATGDAMLRRRSIQILSLLESEVALREIGACLLSDPSAVVRHEAAFLLGTLRSPDAVAALQVALSGDPDALVRHEAAEALGDLGLREARPALQGALKDRSGVVRETAAMALAQIDAETTYRDSTTYGSILSAEATRPRN